MITKSQITKSQITKSQITKSQITKSQINMRQQDFNDQFRERSKKLALKIIWLTSSCKYSDALGVLRKQLVASSTSVAANFRAVCRARSEKERYSKLCIVVEEADETLFWLEMMEEAEFISEKEAQPLKKEAEEILKVMSAFRRKLKAIK